jgi:DedD protein
VERLVKERLVGAAVLLAAAVILIPEMLSGPKREESSQSAAAAEDAPTKTYTIDLGQSSQGPSTSTAPLQVETTAAPPSEMAPPSTTVAPQATPESSVQPTEAKREEPPAPRAKPFAQSQPETPKAAAVTAPSPRNESAPTIAVPKPASVASDRTVPTSKGWAVQLGSFSKADTAERVAQQVRSKGHNAFVMPVKSGSATLYRVRVGPLKDRSAADALQRELKGESPNAAVVPHP